MKKYVCTACGYVYDPEVGDPENGVPVKAGLIKLTQEATLRLFE